MTEEIFIHRKYLPEGTYPKDCIATTEEEIEGKRVKQMLNARVLAAKYGHKPNPKRYKDRVEHSSTSARTQLKKEGNNGTIAG